MKKFFKISVITLVIVIVLFAASQTGFKAVHPTLLCSAAASTECENTCTRIYVTGIGTIKTSPDIATITFTVETKNEILEDAKSENAEKVDAIINTLNDFDIPEDDIKTIGFDVYPEYEWNLLRNLIGYNVNNQIKVKVRDLDKIGQIIDTAIKAGANIVSGVHFSVENKNEYYNAALVKAVGIAKNKALTLAGLSNIDELKIISIKELPNSYFSINEYVSYAKVDAFSTQLFSGEIETSATVELIVELC